MVITWLACARAGMALLVLSPLLADRERRALVARARPALALLSTAPGREPLAAPTVAPMDLPGSRGKARSARPPRVPPRRSPTGPALLRGTMGTTGGLPKLVVAPHRQLDLADEVGRSRWETPDEVYCRASEHHFSPPDICQIFGMGARLFLTRTMQPARLEAEMAEEGRRRSDRPGAAARAGAESAPGAGGVAADACAHRGRAAPGGGAAGGGSALRGADRQLVRDHRGNLLMTCPPGTPAGSIGVPLPLVEARLVDEAGEAVQEGEIGELIVRRRA
ncbi:MAG: hypothetical protein U0232_23825 [Thermomicrobiales bacterium]